MHARQFKRRGCLPNRNEDLNCCSMASFNHTARVLDTVHHAQYFTSSVGKSNIICQKIQLNRKHARSAGHHLQIRSSKLPESKFFMLREESTVINNVRADLIILPDCFVSLIIVKVLRCFHAMFQLAHMPKEQTAKYRGEAITRFDLAQQLPECLQCCKVCWLKPIQHNLELVYVLIAVHNNFDW